MRGYREFNFPAFDSLAAFCREVLGWATINPADHDRDAALAAKGVSDVTKVPGYYEGDLAVYEHTLGQVYDLLTWDVAKIAAECDGIVMLPSWENSTGSRIERFVAEALNKKVFIALPKADGEWAVIEDTSKRMFVSVRVPNETEVSW